MKNIINIHMMRGILLGTALLFSLVACREDIDLPDNLINFSAAELGFEESETEVEIVLSRALETDIRVQVTKEENGLQYGEQYESTPAFEGNMTEVLIPAGSTTGKIILKKKEDALFTGEETIKFQLATIPQGVLMGNVSSLDLSFSEVISEGGQMTINGGGATFPHMVFINLAGNRQVAHQRTDWDLEILFADNGPIAFLNGAVPMLARSIDRTDLNAVIPSDTIGFASTMIVGPNSTAAAAAWVDDASGNPEKTAIGAIASTASENKVYIINLNSANPPSNPAEPVVSRGWRKIRVIRNGNNVEIQHANLNASTFSTITVSKPANSQKAFVSLASGIVSIAPADNRWDFAWSAYTQTIPFQSGQLPYFFQDIIVTNTLGAAAAQVMEADISYASFGSSHLANLNFDNSNRVAIGSNWRSGGGPGSGPSIRSDRYYILRTAKGEHYKVRFISLITDGERGRPQFEYHLVK
jgi:hypothetical protein